MKIQTKTKFHNTNGKIYLIPLTIRDIFLKSGQK